jgi:imidazolonepropionase-like amidohydrolase
MRIVNASVIDGTGAEVRHGVSIDVVDGRIQAVGRRDGDGADGEVVDAAGKWVIPGLINAHEHLTLKGLLIPGADAHYYDIYRTGAEGQLLQCTRSALVSLARGITTVRDAGAAWYASLWARDAIRSGVIPGPRVFTCGQVISIPYEGTDVREPGMTTDAESVEGIVACVNELVGRGVDFIKLKGHRRDFSDLDRTRLFSAEEIVAAGRAAHEHGRKFALHAWHNDVVEAGVDAGVADSVEHANTLVERPDLIDRMARDGIVYVPNLVSWAPTRVPRYPNMAGIPLELVWETVPLAIEKGVPLAAGTDLHTDQLHEELEAFVSLGLRREDALAPVTTNAARLLGLEEQLGTIEPGKLADLVVLDGDPREDLSLLATPSVVISRGNVHSGLELRRLVAAATAEQVEAEQDVTTAA